MVNHVIGNQANHSTWLLNRDIITMIAVVQRIQKWLLQQYEQQL